MTQQPFFWKSLPAETISGTKFFERESSNSHEEAKFEYTASIAFDLEARTLRASTDLYTRTLNTRTHVSSSHAVYNEGWWSLWQKQICHCSILMICSNLRSVQFFVSQPGCSFQTNSRVLPFPPSSFNEGMNSISHVLLRGPRTQFFLLWFHVVIVALS